MSRIKQGAALAVAAALFIGVWEGSSLVAYLDGGGVPTICTGATRGVKMGQTASRAECDAMFTADLIRHETGMRACLKSPDAISDKTYVAFLSFTFNAGVDGFCKSTLARKANAGDLRGACDQLPRWNKDNGRIVRGLVNRRASERELCVAGLR